VAERYDRRKSSVAPGLYDPLNPAFAMLQQERERALIAWVHASGLAPLRDKTLLEVGCGYGSNLLQMISLGFRPANLVGNELLEEALRKRAQRLPAATRVIARRRQPRLGSERFDVVFQSTVFTSLLDPEFRRASRVASGR
jgi:trans-aconitate methyltransferase